MKFPYSSLLLGVAFVGCAGDAPHDNPLDPASALFAAEGQVIGRIVIANKTDGAADVTVTEMEHQLVKTTDSSGNFSFSNLASGVHQFICTKENFTPDTFSVTVASGTTEHITRFMNSAPVVSFAQVLTRKIDQYFPGVEYFVDISATVTDPNSTDGNGIYDVDSVWCAVADTLLYPLKYDPAANWYVATIYKRDFPTNTIDYLVGKTLTIISKDRNDAMNISTPFFVTRVIENTAVPISPSSLNGDTISAWSDLNFSWTPPNVAFNYTYTITLSKATPALPVVVWTLQGISSIKEKFLYTSAANADTTTLDSGTYIWSILVVDEFGNYARSKEASFVKN
jgi:hypothetical protein